MSTEGKRYPVTIEAIQALLEISLDGFLVVDSEGRIRDVNASYCQLSGYSRQELLRMNIAEVVESGKPEKLKTCFERFRQAGNTRYETVHRRKDGSLLDLDVVTHLVQEGRDGVIYAFLRDITEQKRVLARLRAERDLNRRYLEVASSMFVVLNTAGEVVLINRKGCEILGYDKSELIGLNWFEKVIPHEEIEAVKAVFAKLIDGEVAPVEHFDNTVLTSNGEKRLITWTNNYIKGDDGSITGVISCGKDITEREQAEAKAVEERNKLEAVMAALDAGITMQDRNFRILYQNRAHQKMQGRHIGELCYHAYQKREAVCPGCLLERTFQDGKTHHRQVSAPTDDGNIIYLEVSSSPVRDARGEIVAAIEAVRDISDRKKLEQEVQKARNLESLGIFAGGLAHDFNNLLTGILGNLSLLREKLKGGENVGHLMDDIENAGSRAQKLTMQLLTFSKGGAPLLEAISVAEIIRHSTDFILAGSQVRFENNLPAELWPIAADSGQISQVFQNLAQNARQAMPEGGVVRISGNNVAINEQDSRLLRRGRYVKISFADTGCGISVAEISRIFDPYYTTKPDGSGLGLAVCFSIVNKHGGHIEVESVPGQGTIFHLLLPASDGDVPTAATAKKVEAIAGHGRILVMDDEEMIRAVAVAILEHLGYTAEVAEDGEEMLEQYQRAAAAGKPYDAVVMDLTIPGGLGGEQAIKKLLEMDPAARAMVSSGYANDPIIANYRTYGFSGVVVKPFTVEQLAAALSELLLQEDRNDKSNAGQHRGDQELSHK